MALTLSVNNRGLDRLAEITGREFEALMEKVADEVVQDAQSRAPYRTGALHDSISKEQEGPHAWQVFAGVDYAAVVEFGSSRQPGRPYLTPAVEAARERFPELVGEALKTAAQEASG